MAEKRSAKPLRRLEIPPQPLTGSQLLDQEISRFTSNGWLVVSRTENAVQLRKPKQWSAFLLIVGTFGLVLLGSGLVLIALAILDYLTKSDQIVYFTVDGIYAGGIPDPRVSSTSPALIIIALAFAGLFFICALLLIAG